MMCEYLNIFVWCPNICHPYICLSAPLCPSPLPADFQSLLEQAASLAVDTDDATKKKLSKAAANGRVEEIREMLQAHPEWVGTYMIVILILKSKWELHKWERLLTFIIMRVIVQ